MDYVHVYGILHILFLLFILQGIINGSQGQYCSCSGYGGCNFTNKCVPENNCTKENIALGKPANMSSVWNSSVSACLAVNGNTSTSFYTGNDGKSNCVKSSATENLSSWTVDLGQNYTITNITLYTEKSYPMMTGGLQVTVDGNVCFQFKYDLEGQERENIACIKPENGRTIKFYSTRNYYIFFCEIQVWVCIAGLFGPDCSQRCGNCKEGPESCDRYSGICPSGCENGFQSPTCKTACNPGSYGANCKEQCGHCLNNIACNTVNGTCEAGCKDGFAGNLCKGCDEQHYGYNCSNTCGYCSGGICNNISGECIHGCLPGYWNTMCNQECDDGYYGPSCNYTCGTCKQGNICNKITGRCPDGCNRGWTTPYCNQSCLDGYFGSNCSFQCGNCIIGYCDKVDGFCPNGCKSGFIGTFCIQAAVTPEQPENTVGPLVGAIIGGFVILGIIISATIVILRRRKSRSTDSTNTTKTNIVLQPPSNTPFSFKSSTQSETSNEYDDIENHYDSLHPEDDSENHNYTPPAFEERICKSTQQNHSYVNDITKTAQT